MENQLHIHHEHKQNGGKEKQDDAHGSALTFHNLGRIAQEKGDFDAAENWYKNPGDQGKTGNEPGAALTLFQQGLLNQERGKFEQAGTYLPMDAEKFSAVGDAHIASTAMEKFLQTLKQAPADIQAELRELKSVLVFGPLQR